MSVSFKTPDGKSKIVRMPKIDFIDDKADKPVGIYKHISVRPILVFGNSDSKTPWMAEAPASQQHLPADHEIQVSCHN